MRPWSSTPASAPSDRGSDLYSSGPKCASRVHHRHERLSRAYCQPCYWMTRALAAARQSNTRMSRSRIRHFPFCEELHILRQLPTFHDKQVALGRSMETAMDLDSLRPPSSARAGTCHDEA